MINNIVETPIQQSSIISPSYNDPFNRLVEITTSTSTTETTAATTTTVNYNGVRGSRDYRNAIICGISNGGSSKITTKNYSRGNRIKSNNIDGNKSIFNNTIGIGKSKEESMIIGIENSLTNRRTILPGSNINNYRNSLDINYLRLSRKLKEDGNKILSKTRRINENDRINNFEDIIAK